MEIVDNTAEEILIPFQHVVAATSSRLTKSKSLQCWGLVVFGPMYFCA